MSLSTRLAKICWSMLKFILVTKGKEEREFRNWYFHFRLLVNHIDMIKNFYIWKQIPELSLYDLSSDFNKDNRNL